MPNGILARLKSESSGMSIQDFMLLYYDVLFGWKLLLYALERQLLLIVVCKRDDDKKKFVSMSYPYTFVHTSSAYL
jgi:hypothetical protein